MHYNIVPSTNYDYNNSVYNVHLFVVNGLTKDCLQLLEDSGSLKFTGLRSEKKLKHSFQNEILRT